MTNAMTRYRGSVSGRIGLGIHKRSFQFQKVSNSGMSSASPLDWLAEADGYAGAAFVVWVLVSGCRWVCVGARPSKGWQAGGAIAAIPMLW